MSWTKTYKFSDLYEMSSGISSKPEQAGHGSDFLSFSSVFKNHFLPDVLPDLMNTSDKEQETYSILEGDVFLTRTSETLDELGMSSVAIKNYPKATYSGFLKRLRPTQSDVTYPKYLAFYLRSDLFRKTMTNNAIMTLRASLNEQIFTYLDLLLPSYPEQMKIGDLLFDIHQKIDLNNRINAELEGMARLLYEYWFVQFDFPISAALAASMGKPHLEGMPYKTSGGPMVWNAALKRAIPEGWESGTLLDIADFTNGVPCQKYPAEPSQPSYRVIKIREMGEGFTRKSEFVSKRIPEKVIVRNGDVLFSWSATLDVKIWASGTGGLNQHIFKVTSPKYPRSFYYFELLRYLQYFKMVADLRKTTMGHITREHLKESRIAIPPIDLVENLHNLIDPILSKTVMVCEENQHLTELRDWLLPMLMNGQVRVLDARCRLFERIAREIWKKIITSHSMGVEVNEPGHTNDIIVQLRLNRHLGVWARNGWNEKVHGSDMDVFVEIAPGRYRWWALQAKVLKTHGGYDGLLKRSAGSYQWEKLKQLSSMTGCHSRYLLYNGIAQQVQDNQERKDYCGHRFDEDQYGCSLVQLNDMEREALAGHHRFEDFHPNLAEPWRIITCCSGRAGQNETLYSAAQVRQAVAGYPTRDDTAAQIFDRADVRFNHSIASERENPNAEDVNRIVSISEQLGYRPEFRVVMRLR